MQYRFQPIEPGTAVVNKAELWEGIAELRCVCGLLIEMGGAINGFGDTEAGPQTTRCGGCRRIYRARLTLDIWEPTIEPGETIWIAKRQCDGATIIIGIFSDEREAYRIVMSRSDNGRREGYSIESMELDWPADRPPRT